MNEIHWSDPEFLEWERNQIDESRTRRDIEEAFGYEYIKCFPGPSSHVRGVGYSNPMFSFKYEDTGERCRTRFNEITDEEFEDSQL